LLPVRFAIANPDAPSSAAIATRETRKMKRQAIDSRAGASARAQPGALPAAATRNGIQSVEVGASLLAVLAKADGGMALTALAAAAGMAPSKAHRYLTSFMRAGLLERDALTGQFNLGPLSRALGLAALRRQDPVREAGSVMAALRDELQENIVLSVWDEGAPAVIKVEENASALSVRVRIGARLPLLSSSTGQVYAAWLSPALTRAWVVRELEANAEALARLGLQTEDDVARRLDKVRRDGMAAVNSGVLEGISAMAAPVFRYPDTLVAALTVVSIGKPNTQTRGKVRDLLCAAAAELSARLGAQADPQAQGH
jgi:DNA-binding IclR family transcriptional regulator